MAVAKNLDFNWKDAVFGNVDPVYAIYFDVDDGGIITSLPRLTFKDKLPNNFKPRILPITKV